MIKDAKIGDVVIIPGGYRWYKAPVNWDYINESHVIDNRTIVIIADITGSQHSTTPRVQIFTKFGLFWGFLDTVEALK